VELIDSARGEVDHFDQLVQEKLRKDLPIVTTKHAEEELRGIQGNGGGFSEVVSLPHRLLSRLFVRLFGWILRR
jgi:hypothetical protein